MPAVFCYTYKHCVAPIQMYYVVYAACTDSMIRVHMQAVCD